MEPDEIIRNKIMQVEEVPVAWREEWVWSRIEKPEKRKPKLAYAIAASLAIALAAGLAFWQYQKSNQWTMAQMDNLESRLNQYTLSLNPSEPDCKESQEGPGNVTLSKSQPNHLPLLKLKKSPTLTAMRMQPSNQPRQQDTPEIEISPEVFVLVEEPQLEIADTQPHRADSDIDPIIGFIPMHKMDDALTKSTRFRNRFHKSVTRNFKSEMKADHYAAVTARIK